MDYPRDGAMIDKIEFGGWKDCIRIYNREIEVIVTTAVGPRIVSLGYIGGQNFFHLVPEHLGKSGGKEWRIFGGHRLWHAPEAIPRSYEPDNDPVEVSINNGTVTLTQTKEPGTGIIKRLDLEIATDANQITVTHTLQNSGAWDIELAAWALSVLVPGGRAIVPQEPYGEGDAYLLPARPLVLWQYTRMNDARWTWGEKYIQARHDAALTSETKIGILNKQGWVAFALNGELLIKKFPYDRSATYTDLGSNNEIYVNGSFLEIETLSPFRRIAPGEAITHQERWMLAKCDVGNDERSIDARVLPLTDF